MNQIIEKLIDVMFDRAIIAITVRKDEEDILNSEAIILLTDGKTLSFTLPTDSTGDEQLRLIANIIKKVENGKFNLLKEKNYKYEVSGFIFFFEAWMASGVSNIKPTYCPDRQTAFSFIAGDVDGYYNGYQPVCTINGKSFVGDREIDQFCLNGNCTGRLNRVLVESNMKFKKMDDDTMSRVLKEII